MLFMPKCDQSDGISVAGMGFQNVVVIVVVAASVV